MPDIYDISAGRKRIDYIKAFDDAENMAIKQRTNRAIAQQREDVNLTYADEREAGLHDAQIEDKLDVIDHATVERDTKEVMDQINATEAVFKISTEDNWGIMRNQLGDIDEEMLNHLPEDWSSASLVIDRALKKTPKIRQGIQDLETQRKRVEAAEGNPEQHAMEKKVYELMQQAAESARLVAEAQEAVELGKPAAQAAETGRKSRANRASSNDDKPQATPTATEQKRRTEAVVENDSAFEGLSTEQGEVVAGWISDTTKKIMRDKPDLIYQDALELATAEAKGMVNTTEKPSEVGIDSWNRIWGFTTKTTTFGKQDKDTLIADAKQAIANGAPRDAVLEELSSKHGIDDADL